tara:strand:+ start:182 stop:1909 length:1728 start_codon:yes stop_codon:yes gene_type:complete
MFIIIESFKKTSLKKFKFSIPILILFWFCGCSSRDHNKNEKIQTGESYFYVNENSTQVSSDVQNELIINLNRQDLNLIKKKGVINYSDLGAIGDGVSDDAIFIKATHEVANHYGFNVKADDDALYNITGKKVSAIISTNTDFGNATFIIDDTNVDDYTSSIFEIRSKKPSFKINHIKSIKKGQKKINIKINEAALVKVTDNNVRMYIRYGLNQNNGREQTDIFLIDKNGNVNENTPIIWDFKNISEMNFFLIDQEKLIIKGGKFITIANQVEEENHPYYSRNILVNRSNVEINNLKHFVKGEGNHGTPYQGFISIKNASNVKIKNCLLTGHKTYQKIGNAGKLVSRGSYDLSVISSTNVLFKNCRQTNDINDETYWGIFGSNYCKNLIFENCTLSRFDAHMGVYNATIRNSTLGYMGIKLIGFGQFLVEDSTIGGENLVSLRQDYGSTWNGDFKIKNCVFIPSKTKSSTLSLFSGKNSGLHDFGYTCSMPNKIEIDQLLIKDSHLKDYNSLFLFSDFNSNMKNENFEELYPYIKTKIIKINGVNIESKKKLELSKNTFMFKDLKIEKNDPTILIK